MSSEKKIESKRRFGQLVMTRFEKARVLGARALQISMGAPPLIESKATTPLEIAQEELMEAVLPMTIRRRLPDRTHEDLPLKLLLKNQSS